MLIGGIEVGHYGKLTRYALDREFVFKGGIIEVTFQVEKVRGNNDTIAATIALTEEEVEKHL